MDTPADIAADTLREQAIMANNAAQQAAYLREAHLRGPLDVQLPAETAPPGATARLVRSTGDNIWLGEITLPARDAVAAIVMAGWSKIPNISGVSPFYPEEVWRTPDGGEQPIRRTPPAEVANLQQGVDADSICKAMMQGQLTDALTANAAQAPPGSELIAYRVGFQSAGNWTPHNLTPPMRYLVHNTPNAASASYHDVSYLSGKCAELAAALGAAIRAAELPAG